MASNDFTIGTILFGNLSETNIAVKSFAIVRFVAVVSDRDGLDVTLLYFIACLIYCSFGQLGRPDS